MSHPIHRVREFSIVGPYTLGGFHRRHRTTDRLQALLHGVLFGPLQDLTTFNAVTLDLEAGTLVWPNGADFDPATLHDWSQVREELATRSRGWVGEPADQPRANTLGGSRN